MVQLKCSLLLLTTCNKPVKTLLSNILTTQYLRARIICSIRTKTIIFYSRLIWILYKLNIFVYVELQRFKWYLFEIMSAVGYIKNYVSYTTASILWYVNSSLLCINYLQIRALWQCLPPHSKFVVNGSIVGKSLMNLCTMQILSCLFGQHSVNFGMK